MQLISMENTVVEIKLEKFENVFGLTILTQVVVCVWFCHSMNSKAEGKTLLKTYGMPRSNQPDKM